MSMDGLTLGFIAQELKAELIGARIDKVTQPENDMLVLLLRCGGKNRRLLLSASPAFARVHFTEEAYQNPLDAPMFCMLMRKHLTGGRVTECAQLGGDRILRLTIENKDELGDIAPREMYLELMGRHSNLTLVMNGRIIDAIRHVSGDMSRVRQALPGLPFVLPPAQDKIDPHAMDEKALLEKLVLQQGPLDKALGACIRGLSPQTAREIAFRLTGLHRADMRDINPPTLADACAAFFERLPSLYSPCVQTDADGLITDILPFPYLSLDTALQRPYPSLSRALDAFCFGRDRRNRMAQKSAALRRHIKTMTERDEKKLALQEEELTASAKMEEYRVYGELLTAQAYLVPKGAERARLQNFYDESGGFVEIPLDVALSPAQNAQKYFKRYRKARSARELARDQKEKTLAELRLLDQALFDLDACETEEDLADVRKALESEGLLRAQGGKKKPGRAESRPLCFLSPDGCEIRVGKNSAQNDRLTGAARGGETWLHAKDMPGSHVIILSESPSDETLLTAARLAAWYSKGRGANVPVDYTLRKYVKKPGGAPAGFVIYTHQKTLMVSCTEGEINRIPQK